MQEIKCPKCNEVFMVDESDYLQIVQQVRDKEFERELERREQVLKDQQKTSAELQRVRLDQEHTRALNEKDQQLSQKEQEISALKAKLENAETVKKLAVEEARSAAEQKLSDQNAKIITLQGQLNNKETEAQLREEALKKQHQTEIQQKDDQIRYYKDFKARQSTKMIGESLEQHCLTQFNSLRMTAFPKAYFEKDNDARTGSKGDFIFRDYVDDIEYISIMFEMKNEADETKTKHKNEDFFKELDKDRKEKNCEYAVLVSMLEADNELYNNGIVDVSYRYEKMYVIRPQFFIPLITLLKNAARNSLQYQKELQQVRDQQLDIFNFEENLAQFKQGFSKNFKDASERFADAIDGIDKAIAQLEKIKKALTTSEKHLNSANNKLEEVSIKKLTKNAPSVRAMFDALKDEDGE